ncbi:MAG: preprotein translocase subunit SecA [Parcubacteria group bacterium CG2_30_44_11]|nr:MAG: preprotein translocase subunit SecA [Parcubacteria group bacterium CG2_30_44_11]
MSFLDRFFGPSYAKELKQIEPLVKRINDLEAEYASLDEAGLIAAMNAQKARHQTGGESLEVILPNVAALTREASKRTLGLRHYDVQLVGGILLHRGRITEMRTGEGKTLVATLPATLNALTGRGVHVVTVNDYLARRDAVWMGQVYAALGLSLAVINHDASYLYDANHKEVDDERDEHGSFKVLYEFLRPCTRQEAYAADITYGTNSEFGFDYLRDNIEFEPEKIRQRAHAFAIVDEIDSILIDEARTPLIISAPAAQGENLYETFAAIAKQLNVGEHYELDEKMKAATLTDAGVEAAEKMLGIENIYTDRGIKYVHHLETAVRAKGLYTKDKEYVVRDGEVVIVDEFTGRLQPGRRWSDGLHQAVEAKEHVAIQKESKTYAQITYQNFFKMYEKLAGMTGTALTSQEEFYTVYGLDVIPVPTNRPIKRLDRNDLIFQTTKGKYAAVIKKVKALQASGQPVLIGTASIETNEVLSLALTQAGVPHEMLNAKNHEREGEIIANAGRKGAVTLATNMAGRGVDIKLGGIDATPEQTEVVRQLGGLFVLGTERHEARRIDNQLRGRSGRQGDPGETLFMVSMEDQLMRVFGGDRIKNLMGTFGIPEDEPLENRMISRQLEGAQARIEGFHFDARKQVLAYDNVQNQQRQVVYKRRLKLLMGDTAEIEAVTKEVMDFNPSVKTVIDAKRAEFGETAWSGMIQKLALQMIDILWVEHLEVMQYTRSSVSLRAYGQKDPLLEYRKEGLRLFKEMQAAVIERMAEVLPQLQPAALEREEAELRKERIAAQQTGGDGTGQSADKQQPRIAPPEIGRNELVTITNGTETQTLKYKKVGSLLAAGWKLVS